MFYQSALRAKDDFWALHRLGETRSLLRRVTRQPTCLRPFATNASKSCPSMFGQRTLRDVPIAKIIGSVGRSCDYTPEFLPRQVSDEARWVRVRRAIDSEGTPPIELYRLGESYFVEDGHHRVSVMRSLGAREIEAYVTDVRVHAVSCTA